MKLEEDYFIEKIEKETGLKAGKEWGIIAGTQSPYPKQGMYSAGNFVGFEVWKSKDGVEKEGLFYKSRGRKNIENIINFLKSS